MIRLGVDVIQVAAVIKQGSTGSMKLGGEFVKDEAGTPLDSYDGWTASIALFRAQSGSPELTLTPTVEGVPAQKLLLITVSLAKGDTNTKQPGVLNGDLKLLAPNGDEYFPANISLEIEKSFSAP